MEAIFKLKTYLLSLFMFYVLVEYLDQLNLVLICHNYLYKKYWVKVYSKIYSLIASLY